MLLVEAGPRILADFPEHLSAYAARYRCRHDVEVRTGCRVEDIRSNGAIIASQFIPVSAIVWGAGVRASPAGHWLGVPSDRLGRIPVDEHLRVIGCPAIGDTANFSGSDGKPLPGLAQVAKQQASTLDVVFAAAVDSKPFAAETGEAVFRRTSEVSSASSDKAQVSLFGRCQPYQTAFRQSIGRLVSCDLECVARPCLISDRSQKTPIFLRAPHSALMHRIALVALNFVPQRTFGKTSTSFGTFL